MAELSSTPPGLVRFGVFELDLQSGELRKAGVRVGLQEQQLQVLTVLLERPGNVVTREQLRQRLWPGGTFVDFEHGVNAVINRLRDTLGDSAETPRFIETLPRRGYRFVGAVNAARGIEPQAGMGVTKGRFRQLTIAAAVLLIAGIAALATWQSGQRGNRSAPRPEPRHTQATFAGDVLAAALSPDGRTVAYASGVLGRNVRVLVRDLAAGQPLEIWNGNGAELSWLPNGSQLFVGGDGVALVSRFGGASRRITRLGAYTALSPDGSLFAHSSPNLVGFQVSSVDGTRTWPVTLQGFRWLLNLDWNAVTNRISILSTDDTESTYTVWSVMPDGKEVRRLYSDTLRISAMCSSPTTGVLYLFRERNGGQELVSVPLSGEQDQTPKVLITGFPRLAHENCDVSADGERLLYTRGSGPANIWRLDLGGAEPAATQLTRGTSVLAFPRVSPDGQWIVATQGTASDRRIVKVPIGGGEPVPFAAGRAAVWSPDGQRLAFLTGPSPQRVWISDADGLGPKQVDVKDATSLKWLSDGRLAWKTPDGRNYRIREVAGGGEELLVKNPEVGWVFEPQFSPRGNQVAVFWNRTEGTTELERGLWLLSWPAREARKLAPNLWPVGWSANGEWVYAYEASTRAVVRVSPRTSTIEPVGSFPHGTLEVPEVADCSLTPDRHAIVCAVTERYADAWIVDHFDPEVHDERR